MPRPSSYAYWRPTPTRHYYFTTNTGSRSNPPSRKILIGFFIAFIAFIIVLICSCVCLVSRSRRVQVISNDITATAAGQDAVEPAGGKVGLNSDALACLPIFVYGDKGNVECVVCLMEFDKGEECRLLPRCGHSFHAECVDMWLRSHTTCPLCRASAGAQPLRLSTA